MRPFCWWRWEHDEPLLDLHRKFLDGFSTWKSETRRQSFEFLKSNNLLLPAEEENFIRQETDHSKLMDRLKPSGLWKRS
jgi:hypothetical protein